MGSLFSRFDSMSSFINFPLNWASVLVFMAFFPGNFYLKKNKFIKAIYELVNYLFLELKISIGSLKTPGLRHIFISLFILIGFSNFMGLFPYVFTASRHITITVALALPIWLGYIILSTFNNLNFFLSHLVPIGTPYPLIPFIVLIEIIRRVIRPLTLSVRLAANIVAGHLLIILIRSPMNSLTWAIFRFTLLALLALLMLELAVSFIQSYVFTTLISLYIIEVNSPHF